MCTPLMASKTFLYHDIIDTSEIVIPYEGHEEPDCMVFSGTLSAFIGCKSLMNHAIRKGFLSKEVPFIEMPVNIGIDKQEPSVADLYKKYGKDFVDRCIEEYEEYIHQKTREQVNLIEY